MAECMGGNNSDTQEVLIAKKWANSEGSLEKR